MRYNIVGSSSKGNAIIVEDMLMLDCGVSYISIKKYLKKVKLIFISHAHQDHLLETTIKKIVYNHPTIKFLTGSKEVIKKMYECKVPIKCLIYLKIGKWYDLGLLKVKLEQLYHDTTNCALKWQINDKKGIYAVDTSKIDHIKAKNYDLYLIESNYTEQLLKQHIEECEDKNELYYLNRVSNTHLSFEQANSFLIENMGVNSAYQYIHKSNYNFEEVEE